MDAEFINPFITVATHVVSSMAGLHPVAGEPYVKGDILTYGVVTGFIGMMSETASGNFCLSFDESAVLAVVSAMLGEEFKKVDHDVIDAVGELTNIVCGGVKREFGDAGFEFNLASPLVVAGKGVRLAQHTKSTILVIPFQIPQGTFVLESNLRKVPGK